MILVQDIAIHKYESIDLFRGVRSVAKENGVKLSKYIGFRWHPLSRENQR